MVDLLVHRLDALHQLRRQVRSCSGLSWSRFGSKIMRAVGGDRLMGQLRWQAGHDWT
ncbi:hypothetical protein D3C80_786280 [compost metagenome]